MDDLISRQAAIEIIKNYCENGCDIAEDNWCPSCQREKFVELLKALPSAQSERKKGKWIKKKGSLWTLATCSVCGELSVEGDKPFCPNCGAEMGGKS